MRKASVLCGVFISLLLLASCDNTSTVDTLSAPFNEERRVYEEENLKFLGEEALSDLDLSQFREHVIADTDAYKLTIVEFEFDDAWGPILRLSLRNKLTDVDIQCVCEPGSILINNITAPDGFSILVQAGEEVEKKFVFDPMFLKTINGFEVTDLELRYRIERLNKPEDSSNKSTNQKQPPTTELIDSQMFNLHPYGEQNAIAFSQEILDAEGGVVLLENDDLLVLATRIQNHDFIDGEYELQYYVVNKTDSKVTFSMVQSKMNDVDAYYSTSPSVIAPQSCGHTTMAWTSQEFERCKYNPSGKNSFVCSLEYIMETEDKEEHGANPRQKVVQELRFEL